MYKTFPEYNFREGLSKLFTTLCDDEVNPVIV